METMQASTGVIRRDGDVASRQSEKSCAASARAFKGSLSFIANPSARQVGVKVLYLGATNPFRSMSERIYVKHEKNLYEAQVTEYQAGGLRW